METGYFSVLSNHTPRRIFFRFGTRNSLTEAQYRENALGRALTCDDIYRAEYAKKSHGLDFRSFCREKYAQLSDSSFEEAWNIVDLQPSTKKLLLYVFPEFLFLTIRNQ